MFLPLIGYIVDRIPLFHSEAKATCRCSSLQSMHMHDAAVTGRSLTLLLIQIHALLVGYRNHIYVVFLCLVLVL